MLALSTHIAPSERPGLELELELVAALAAAPFAAPLLPDQNRGSALPLWHPVQRLRGGAGDARSSRAPPECSAGPPRSAPASASVRAPAPEADARQRAMRKLVFGARVALAFWCALLLLRRGQVYTMYLQALNVQMCKAHAPGRRLEVWAALGVFLTGVGSAYALVSADGLVGLFVSAAAPA